MRFTLLILLTVLIAGCETAPVKITDSPEIVTKAGVSTITPEQALPGTEAAYSQFIDVRTPEEYAAGHANRTRNIPLDQLGASLDMLEKNEPVYIICRTDNRSTDAARMLVEAGFKQAIVVKGGTEAWEAAGLPMGAPPPRAEAGKLDERTRQALVSALEDERRAYATYEAVLAKFPNARPFSNIVAAEKRHESFLLSLFSKYNVTVPKNEFDPAKLDVPTMLTEACAAGVDAEKANIALYDELLSFVRESDIREVFVQLQSASRDNHLPAFTRCREGGRGPGARRGRAL
jgi:rhodanese-related sulfurtransferase